MLQKRLFAWHLQSHSGIKQHKEQHRQSYNLSVTLPVTYIGSVLCRDYITCLRQYLPLLILRAAPKYLEKLDYVEDPLLNKPGQLHSHTEGTIQNVWELESLSISSTLYTLVWERTASCERSKMKEVQQHRKAKRNLGRGRNVGRKWDSHARNKGKGARVWGRRIEERSPALFLWTVTTSTFNLTDPVCFTSTCPPHSDGLSQLCVSPQPSKAVTDSSCTANLLWHHQESEFCLYYEET